MVNFHPLCDVDVARLPAQRVPLPTGAAQVQRDRYKHGWWSEPGESLRGHRQGPAEVS